MVSDHDLNKIHERIDGVYGEIKDLNKTVNQEIKEISNYTSKLEERSLNQDKNIEKLCKMIMAQYRISKGVELEIKDHELNCPARYDKKQDQIRGGIAVMKQHPFITVMAIAGALLSILRELGYL